MDRGLKKSKISASTWAAIGAVALALILGFTYLYQIRNYAAYKVQVQGTDMYTYHNYAAGIAQGKGFVADIHYSPLYPFVFLPLIYFLFGLNPFTVYAAQVLMEGLCVFLTFLIARKVFGDITAVAAAYISALYGYFIIFSGTLLAEVLINLVFLLAIWSFLLAVEKPGLKFSMLCGFLFGAAVLAKPTMMGFIPFLLIPWFAKRGANLKALAGICVVFACAALTVLPVTIRNYRITGKFIPVSAGGGYAFIYGNSPDSSGAYVSTPFIKKTAKESEGMDDAASEKFIVSRTLDALKKDPSLLPGLIAKKFSLFWGRWEIPNNIDYYYHSYTYNKRMRPPVLDFQLLIPWEILVAFGAAGMVFSLKKWKEASVLYLFIIVYSLIVISMMVVGRFRLPVFPFLAIFSACALREIFGLARSRKYALLAGILAIAGGIAFIEYGYARTLFSPSGIYTRNAGTIGIREENLHLTGIQFLGSEVELARKKIMLDLDPGSCRKAHLEIYFRFVDKSGYVNVFLNSRQKIMIPAAVNPSGKPEFMFFTINVPPASLCRGLNAILIQPCAGARIYIPYDFSYRYARSDFFNTADDYGEKIPGEYAVRLRLEK